ncbi:hypothetical protein COF68_06315 [Bacillus toyonensis]|uniref:hypothetical protein n=1 Tax=Bacillus toyonensis TaxID=155322 RepID=UPI000BFD0258|nr:hypothetical protein [Bacillus toyonensis]PHE64448.1 hypothetical protein COF68_06315 [Bacillus toyonensis]
MSVKRAGVRRIRNNGDAPPSLGYQTYSYISPKVSLECEKLSEEELKAMSSEVKTYNINDLDSKKEG